MLTEAHSYPRGREFCWYDFKSSSTRFGVMYNDYFCGDRGPRTIFTIEGVKCYKIKIFSAIQVEDEALFPPLSAFRVVSSQKRLEPQHLREGAPAGGFPDEVQLTAPAPPEAIPAELKLTSGREVIDFTKPALGSGSFADVRGGEYAFSAQQPAKAVAFKVFRGTHVLDKTLRQQIIEEARIGLRLQHAHLVELYGILEIPSHGLALVLELAEGGSLRAVLTDTAAHPDLSWERRVRWLTEIGAGLQKLHTLSPRPLIHRDLKAGNVLLSSRDLSKAVAKVCDFGVAKFMQTMATRASAAGGGGGGGGAGTLPWKAPETFIGQYDTTSDMFAFGVTAFEVLSRKVPYEGLSEPEIIRKTQARFELNEQMTINFGITAEQQQQLWNQQNPLSSRRPDLFAVEPGCPAELVALVGRCWDDQPAARPTAAQALAELQRMGPEQQQQPQQQQPQQQQQQQQQQPQQQQPAGVPEPEPEEPEPAGEPEPEAPEPEELRRFIVETFGEKDSWGNKIWDPSGCEGGLEIWCAVCVCLPTRRYLCRGGLAVVGAQLLPLRRARAKREQHTRARSSFRLCAKLY